jgi:hypothetical protein
MHSVFGLLKEMEGFLGSVDVKKVWSITSTPPSWRDTVRERRESSCASSCNEERHAVRMLRYFIPN